MISERVGPEEMQRALEATARFVGGTDEVVVAALDDAYGEIVAEAAAQLELDRNAFRSQLAQVVEGADSAEDVGPFFGVDLGRQIERRIPERER